MVAVVEGEERKKEKELKRKERVSETSCGKQPLRDVSPFRTLFIASDPHTQYEPNLQSGMDSHPNPWMDFAKRMTLQFRVVGDLDSHMRKLFLHNSFRLPRVGTIFNIILSKPLFVEP